MISSFNNEFIVCLLVAFPPQQAIFKLVPKDEVAQLPDDENTADKRADKLWKFFDKGENGKMQMKVNEDNNGLC